MSNPDPILDESTQERKRRELLEGAQNSSRTFIAVQRLDLIAALDPDYEEPNGDSEPSG